MTGEAMRPDPIQRIDSAFFWEACERGELVAQKFTASDKLWHPPRPMCPDTRTTEKTVQRLSGRGRVLSWAAQVRPAAFGFAESPVVVLVELEEGVRMVATLEGVSPDDMEFGIEVVAGFAKTSGGKTVPVFHPVKEDAAR